MIGQIDHREERRRAEHEVERIRDEMLGATTAARAFAQALQAISAGHPDPVTLAGMSLRKHPGWERDSRAIRHHEPVGRTDTLIPPGVGLGFGRLTAGRWLLVPLDANGDRLPSNSEIVYIEEIHKQGLGLGSRAHRGAENTLALDYPHGFAAVSLEDTRLPSRIEASSGDPVAACP